MANRYFFEGRNTGIIANSASEARAKKKRGGDKIVATHRNITPPKNGAWDRTRRDGQSPAKSKYGKGRGHGPPRS
jgi:hypothetical protein